MSFGSICRRQPPKPSASQPSGTAIACRRHLGRRSASAAMISFRSRAKKNHNVHVLPICRTRSSSRFPARCYERAQSSERSSPAFDDPFSLDPVATPASKKRRRTASAAPAIRRSIRLRSGRRSFKRREPSRCQASRPHSMTISVSVPPRHPVRQTAAGIGRHSARASPKRHHLRSLGFARAQCRNLPPPPQSRPRPGTDAGSRLPGRQMLRFAPHSCAGWASTKPIFLAAMRWPRWRSLAANIA